MERGAVGLVVLAELTLYYYLENRCWTLAEVGLRFRPALRNMLRRPPREAAVLGSYTRHRRGVWLVPSVAWQR